MIVWVLVFTFLRGIPGQIAPIPTEALCLELRQAALENAEMDVREAECVAVYTEKEEP